MAVKAVLRIAGVHGLEHYRSRAVLARMLAAEIAGWVESPSMIVSWVTLKRRRRRGPSIRTRRSSERGEATASACLVHGTGKDDAIGPFDAAPIDLLGRGNPQAKCKGPLRGSLAPSSPAPGSLKSLLSARPWIGRTGVEDDRGGVDRARPSIRAPLHQLRKSTSPLPTHPSLLPPTARP